MIIPQKGDILAYAVVPIRERSRSWFTGIAAFFGVFMNASFLFAGTAGANPLMALVAILLVLAWRVAGWWGLDRRILPAIGVPGAPGSLFGGRRRGGRQLQ